VVKPITLALLMVLLPAGCSESGSPSPDLSAALLDLSAPPGLTLQTPAATRQMAAFYSLLVEPIEGGSLASYLVVTIVEPAFNCDAPSAPAPSLDAISFEFGTRAPGARQDAVIARRGPTLGGAGEGFAELSAVDDRFAGWDGGAIEVGAGGAVDGRVAWTAGEAQLRGPFHALHCAALDVAAAP